MRILLFSIALCIFSTVKAQEKPQAIEISGPNTLSHFAGLSGMTRYYYPDSLNMIRKDAYWSHTISYDRTFFPWLEAGVYLTHSFSNKFDRPHFTINLTCLGLEAKLRPLRLIVKRPQFVDIYGFLRGGINYMYYTNVSETMQQQLEEQGSSISQWNNGMAITHVVLVLVSLTTSGSISL